MQPDIASLRRPRAIIFDWDNTLVDSWGTIHDALNFLMAAMEKPLWTIEETRERVRLSLRDAFPVIFGERWEEARQIYMDRFQAIHLARLTPLPGRDAMLRALAPAHYLAIVSNKTGPVLRAEAEHIGWSSLFASIVGAGDAHTDKPHCAPVELALQASGIEPGPEVWFVGDTAVDMECAIAAGCVPVLLGVAEGSDEFAQFPPALTFADDAALFRALRDLR
ncbi:MAG TPA: HAD hydrolase-like protein [Stellaceae bacterium]|jgi:phosphoglycolate phosphatase|nr:HAD hydrolase-like protein [Stellaceae bacterium]